MCKKSSFFHQKLVASKIEKIKARSVIKFLHLKGYCAYQIHDEINGFGGDDCPSYDTDVR